MRLPRQISGAELADALRIGQFGYQITRQTGSHMRLTSLVNGEHHVTIPKHNPLRVGTMTAILTDVAEHHSVSREELVKRLFGR